MSQDPAIPEEPPIVPDPVVTPGQDPAGPLPGIDSPEPPAPPELEPGGSPQEIPSGPSET